MYGLVWRDTHKTEMKALGVRLLANPNKMKHAMGIAGEQPIYKEFKPAAAKLKHRPVDSIRQTYFTI